MSRILILDDDPDILKFCEGLLVKQGHEVLTSTYPSEALQILSTHNVDLLILDVVMPPISGFDVLRSVRSIEHFNAPVLMLTRRKSPEDVKTAMNLGAVDYMIKPIDADIFISKVGSIIGKKNKSPEVKFAIGPANLEATLSLPAVITSVTEMGVRLRTTTYIDRNIRLVLNSTLFKEIGIDTPLLRAGGCQPIENDPKYRYETFISFIGLDDVAMQKIRRWINSKAISLNKEL
ncbi:MAG: PleD family two-component system response regulator [Bacteriovoracia bacterium]